MDNQKPKKPHKYQGVGRCSCAYDKNTGRILKVLDDPPAICRWARKHFGEERIPMKHFWNRADILKEFDNQMKIGLSNLKVISELLWFGGVSTTRE